MVVAGPGTGKTQVLAARIANILLQTDTKPYNILALTFTESAAKNMRERVIRLIGNDGYYVQISTFHSFCSEVIKSHPEFFPIDRSSAPLTDLERYDLFQSIILDLELDVLKPMNRKLFYITDIMKGVSNLKREDVTPENFAKIVQSDRKAFEQEEASLKKTEQRQRAKTLEKQEELVLVYFEYQKRLREMLRYDFDDMISLVVAAFQEHELLLLEYQEKLQYFLVDEYQDTNAAQNAVVDLLASYWEEKANIFVVGDPHQAIYRFQGASVENMLGFISRYQQATVVTLATGYRCPQTIYDAAWTSISHNELTSAEAFKIQNHRKTMEAALDKKLISPKGQGEEIQLFEAPSQTLEIVYIAEKIRKLMDDGVSPEEIAILYRYNSDASEIQEVLEKWEIPYEIDGGVNILETESIRQLLEFFFLIHNIRSGDNDINLYEVMSYDWLGLDEVMVMKIARAAGKAKMGMLELVLAGYPKFSELPDGKSLSAEEFATAAEFVKKLFNWSAEDAKLVFPRWFEQVINESGFLEWVLTHPAKIELLNNLNSLYREVKALADSRRGLQMEQFLEAITVMYEHNIALQAEDLNADQGAVRLSTVHRAKGQEWDYVFLVHCIDGRWGNARSRDLLPLPEGLIRNTDLSKKELNEDERRIFYVALTRAKMAAMISYPETVISGNRSREVVGSMFINEVAEQLVKIPDSATADFVKESDQYLARLLSPIDLSPTTPSEEEFFKEIVDDFKLSVTGLNTYLRDQQEFVNNVLLKVPRAKPAPMAFGTAVHSALEEYYKHLQVEGEQMDAKVLQDVFSKSLEAELLEPAEFKRRLKYGRDILAAYHQQVEIKNIEPLFIERFFGFGFSRTVLDDITLTGRIDRVDWLDKDKKLVRLVDYKTGKAKSNNVIEGKVASANLSEREETLPDSIKGPYKRQLLFYKLLTDLDKSFLPVATEGVFDFVEPTKPSGKLVQRSFELSNDDVNDLKELIREVMSEIRSLKFLEDIKQL